MKNWTFRQWNTVLGWVVFAIAFITYLSTIEPNFSFWDCGEYISSAVKLEVTHAPGAALFQYVVDSIVYNLNLGRKFQKCEAPYALLPAPRVSKVRFYSAKKILWLA